MSWTTHLKQDKQRKDGGKSSSFNAKFHVQCVFSSPLCPLELSTLVENKIIPYYFVSVCVLTILLSFSKRSLYRGGRNQFIRWPFLSGLLSIFASWQCNGFQEFYAGFFFFLNMLTLFVTDQKCRSVVFIQCVYIL